MTAYKLGKHLVQDFPDIFHSSFSLYLTIWEYDGYCDLRFSPDGLNEPFKSKLISSLRYKSNFIYYMENYLSVEYPEFKKYFVVID